MVENMSYIYKYDFNLENLGLYIKLKYLFDLTYTGYKVVISIYVSLTRLPINVSNIFFLDYIMVV